MKGFEDIDVTFGEPPAGRRQLRREQRRTTAESAGRTTHRMLAGAGPILTGMGFEEMWRDLLPIGRDAATGGYHRSPFASAERECAAWYVEQAVAAARARR